MIELAAVGLKRGAATLLEDFSLRLPDPGLYLLAGPSGSGKSLLGRMLSGRLKPQRGRVKLDGTPLYTPLSPSPAPLQYIELGPLHATDELLEEYLEAEVWRTGAGGTALEGYWDTLGELIPGAHRRFVDSLSLGELALAQVALAAAAESRVTVLDGQLSYLAGTWARRAAWMLQEAAHQQQRFIVVTALSSDAQLGGIAARFQLGEGLPVSVRRVSGDAEAESV